MEMSGEERIAAPRQQVWEALNDPEILKQCITGCEEMTKTEDGGFAAKVKAKVGPVSARFSGKVTLSNLNPPASYTISGEGTGGAAGFAKGGADVQLEDEGEATLLRYQVNASVGGKLAQIGQRLVKGTAEKYAQQFFSRFGEIVANGQPAPAGTAPVEPTAPTPAASEAPGATVPPAATGTPEVESLAQAAGEPSANLDATEAAPTPEPTAPEPAVAEPTAAEPTTQETATAPGKGLSPKVWIAGVIVAVLALLLIFTS